MPAKDASLFLAAATIGELRRGVELIRHRGDQPQEERLEQWLQFEIICAGKARFLINVGQDRDF